MKSITFSIILLLLYSCTDNKSYSNTITKVELKELNKPVFIESKAWGLAGNHEIIQITTSDNCDTIVFYTDQVFYRTKGLDTLVLYTTSSSYSETPKSICSEIHLQINDLENYDDIKRIENNYKENGLKKVSIYDTK